MASLQDDRTRFLSALSRLRARFATAARAYEKDDHATATEEALNLVTEIDKLLDDHIHAYPAALKENRLGFLFQAMPKDSIGGDPMPADRLLMLLIRSEKALHLLQGEIQRSYPSETIWRRLGQRKRLVLWTAGGLISALLIGYLFTPKHGLQGEYYDGGEFQKLIKRRVDRRVDFDWGFSGPVGLVDHFSVRWTGFVLAPREGTYEFLVRSDDGARLWINDKLVIDHWDLHPEATDRANVILEKGPCSIRLEYFEFARKAVCQLMWRPAGSSDETPIPSKNLVPSERDLPKS